MPINITMPALSPTMTEGTLSRWLKAEGDAVKAGDVIAEIETDKATMEVEAADEGVLGKILVPEGTEHVAVNAPIAVLLEEGEDPAQADAGAKPPVASASHQNPSRPFPSPQPSPGGRGGAGGSGPVIPSAGEPRPSPILTSGSDTLSRREREGEGKDKNRIFASPLARRIADEKGVNLAQVKGSGPRGRIIKADVESNPSPRPSPGGRGGLVGFGLLSGRGGADGNLTYTEIPLNTIKKITAARLVESKQTIPHFYLTVDCIIDDLLKARAAINAEAKEKFKLSVNDFIIKAAAMALKTYPAANVSWAEDRMLQYHTADISVAVSTPNGLITPIVRGAEGKGLRAISEEVKGLAGRARAGKLKPEEFQGGSFTVSNLGMYGVKDFAAIINPPQACILAVGAGIETPIVEKGEIKIRTVMSCTLSVDHRAVDGASGAEYLQILKRYIENPMSMLI